MLACRLCLRLGIADPEKWLAETDKRVFDLWKAYFAVEPFGNEDTLLAVLTHNVAKVVCSNLVQGQEKHWVTVGELLPQQWIGQPEPQDNAPSVDSLKAMAKECQQLSTPTQSLSVSLPGALWTEQN